MINNLFKIFIIFSMFSCDSKRILFVTELTLRNENIDQIIQIIKNYEPNFDLNATEDMPSKYCYIINKKNPIFFCKKNNAVAILSSYKAKSSVNMLNLEDFLSTIKNKNEEESFKIHREISNSIIKTYAIEEKVYLLDYFAKNEKNLFYLEEK